MNDLGQQQRAFVSFFNPSIRVLFNWSRFCSEAWPIDILVLSEHQQLDQLYLPWYLSPSGEEVGFDAPNSDPVVVSHIPHIIDSLGMQRQEKIKAWAQVFAGYSEPIQLTVPMYSVSSSDHIVLDGCHRISALAMSKVAFRILALAVNGPKDAEVLPDLKHWLPSTRNST